MAISYYFVHSPSLSAHARINITHLVEIFYLKTYPDNILFTFFPSVSSSRIYLQLLSTSLWFSGHLKRPTYYPTYIQISAKSNLLPGASKLHFSRFNFAWNLPVHKTQSNAHLNVSFFSDLIMASVSWNFSHGRAKYNGFQEFLWLLNQVGHAYVLQAHSCLIRAVCKRHTIGGATPIPKCMCTRAPDLMIICLFSAHYFLFSLVLFQPFFPYNYLRSRLHTYTRTRHRPPFFSIVLWCSRLFVIHVLFTICSFHFGLFFRVTMFVQRLFGAALSRSVV